MVRHPETGYGTRCIYSQVVLIFLEWSNCVNIFHQFMLYGYVIYEITALQLLLLLLLLPLCTHDGRRGEKQLSDVRQLCGLEHIKDP